MSDDEVIAIIVDYAKQHNLWNQNGEIIVYGDNKMYQMFKSDILNVQQLFKKLIDLKLISSLDQPSKKTRAAKKTKRISRGAQDIVDTTQPKLIEDLPQTNQQIPTRNPDMENLKVYLNRPEVQRMLQANGIEVNSQNY